MNLLSDFPAVPIPNLPDPACVDYPTELFFPTAGTDGREAKAVCAFCPSRKPCLEWALATGEPFGVYGGMSGPERQRLLRGAA